MNDDSALLRFLRGEAEAPRTLVVFAHPDDETIGAGALLARLDDVQLLCATDGAPHDRRWWGDPACASRAAYAELRRRELEAAISCAGVIREQLRQLAMADQTLSRDMAGLSQRVAHAITEAAPTVVVTHPYEGGHPDHDAVAFAVHTACALLRRAASPAPEIAEFASYHARDGGLETGSFLPSDKFTAWTHTLPPDEQAVKRRMVDAYASQRETLAQFGVQVERYRPAPPYDFTAPPHEGPLWYERFEWGCTGAEWRAWAAEALANLGLRGE